MLIIFIDALPFEVSSKKFRSLDKFNSKGIKPGFGYSVNLHAELFSGLGPNETGYFGEYVYNRRKPKLNWLSMILAKLEFKFPRITRLIRLALNVITRRRVGYMPLILKDRFTKKGVYPLQQDTPFNTIFKKAEFKKFIADSVKAGVGKKDSKILDDAYKSIENRDKNIILSMCDLDGMYHEYGTEHKKIYDKYDWLDGIISDLTSKYLKEYPKEDIFILSDHGICDAHTHVTFDYRKYEREIFSGELTVFFDSLYLLFWAENEELYKKINEDLKNLPGYLLSKDERIDARLDSNEFGDGIFLLNEGYGFCPNFFGFRPLKSYHGYNPKFAKSKGTLSSTMNIDTVERNTEVYDLLLESLSKNHTIS